MVGETATKGQAFVAVRSDGRSWVADLPMGDSVLVGPDDEAVVYVADLALGQARVHWDGRRLTLERIAKTPLVFVNGKVLEARTELQPGDELVIGDTRIVVGLANTQSPSGRRAFTHEEFRERLSEELARASRRGRPTGLAMVRARPGDGAAVLEAALASFRAGDVVATYAHDEFEFLFPDTAAEHIEKVVGRVLASTELAGLSVGLSVAPIDADTPERLIRSARRALARSEATPGALVVRADPLERDAIAVRPVLKDAASEGLAEALRALAVGTRPVQLRGEASVGKGVFARIIHEAGSRRDAPYRVLRCASLVDPERITRELGPRGGLPAGAECDVLAARGGTLVLDEVSELLPDPQERLLALLQRLGDEVRLVATTQVDLKVLTRRGAFLSELAALLEGEVVEVPALRARPDDIVPLAEEFAREAGSTGVFSPGALARLRSYPWPGNVLELRNAVERAARLAAGGEVLSEHLPSADLQAGRGRGRLRQRVDSIERDAIMKALADNNHNQTHAARRLGISRRALIYKMEKYGLKPPPGKGRR